MIVQRGEAIGLDWEGTMARRRQHDWEAELRQVGGWVGGWARLALLCVLVLKAG